MLVAERDVWVAGRGAPIANGTSHMVTESSHAAEASSAGLPPLQRPTLAWLTSAEVQEALGRGPGEGPQPPLLLGETGSEVGDGGKSGGLRFAIPVEREEPASLRMFAVQRGSHPLCAILFWRPYGSISLHHNITLFLYPSSGFYIAACLEEDRPCREVRDMLSSTACSFEDVNSHLGA